MLIFFILIVTSTVFGFIGSSIANNKGIESKTGFLYGFFLGPLGLIIVALLSTPPSQAVRGALAQPPGKVDLENDAYKIWLVKNYQIEKNEALESFICDGRLFTSIDEAIRHAHDMEQSARSLAKAGEARAEANRAAVARANEAEALARRARRSATREQVLQILRENRARALRVIVIIAVVSLAAGGWALARFIARTNAQNELQSEMAAAQAKLTPIETQLNQAIATRTMKIDQVAKGLREAEIKKVKFRVARGNSHYHNLTITNNSKYNLEEIDGNLTLYSGSYEIKTHESCCEFSDKEDKYGFDLRYKMRPSESLNQEKFLINYTEVSDYDSATRKMIADRHLRTYSYLFSRYFVIDSVKFVGNIDFVNNPIRSEVGSNVIYTRVPVDFRSLAESQIDLTEIDRQIAALKPIFEARRRDVALVEKRLYDLQ